MSPAAGPRHESVQYRRKALPLGLVRRVLRRQQSRVYEAFERAFPPRPDLRVLDLGVNGSLERPEQHFFEWHYPYRTRIVAAGLEPAELFRSCYPEIDYVRVERDGALPFADGEFDIVCASAVVEHVGSRQRQREFLAEVARVGRAAFVTTPNRWYPVELHTALPLVHFLPTRWYRAVFRTLGFHFFADEANLNLLDRRSLAALVPAGVEARILRHRFLGPTSNFLLIWGESAAAGNPDAAVRK